MHSLTHILEVVSRECGIGTADLKSRSKFRHICRARGVYCRVAFELGYSSAPIGLACNRDHSTVLHSLKIPLEKLEPELSRVKARLAVSEAA